MTTVESLPIAGRELDALIAERVMGWCRSDDPHQHAWGYFAANGDWQAVRWCEPTFDVTPFNPSTDIAAAWEVIEKLDEKWFVKIEKRGDRREEGRYFERWACHLWPGDFEAEAETAPLAICLAALAALKAVAP